MRCEPVARGYLLKGAEQAEIDRALRAVAAGEAIFGPGVAARVLGYFAGPRRGRRGAVPRADAPGAGDPRPASPPVERNAAIARALGLAPKTVSNHLSSIFTKLAVADRAEAIARVREGGFGRRAGP